MLRAGGGDDPAQSPDGGQDVIQIDPLTDPSVLPGLPEQLRDQLLQQCLPAVVPRGTDQFLHVAVVFGERPAEDPEEPLQPRAVVPGQFVTTGRGQLGQDDLDQLVDQGFLVGEMPVDGPDPHPGAAGDLLHPGVQAELGDHDSGGLKNELAVPPGVPAHGPGRRPGCADGHFRRLLAHPRLRRPNSRLRQDGRDHANFRTEVCMITEEGARAT